MIDLHSHILPGADDGAADLEESLEMARGAVAHGVHTVVATPHTLNGAYEHTADRVRKQTEKLQRAVEEAGIELKVIPGSEVHLRPGGAARVISGESGTLNLGGRYVLVEFPFQTLYAGTDAELYQLKKENITPIIAHPERNLILQSNLKIIHEYVRMGCLTQLTAMSITGELGEGAMDCAHQMLQLRLAHVIASDAHSAVGRTIRLSDAVAAAAQVTGDREGALAMVTTTPEILLKGEPYSVPEPLEAPQKKSFFKFW